MPSTHLYSTEGPAPRALLLAIQTPFQADHEVQTSLGELGHLLAGLGIRVHDSVVQRRYDARDTHVLGSGKLEELKQLVAPDPIEGTERREQPPWLVVFDGELTPGQQRGLGRELGVEVVDRTQVILSVFQRRASTRIAQLEIELARLKYEAPRVRDQDSVLAQQAGGGGRGGKGHTGAELKKQELRRRISALGTEIEQAQRSQLRRRQRRQELERVALVGYTNAGKSSWMRALTGSEVQVEDALFATLDTTVRALSPATSPRVVLADTVGFLRNLPNHLLASFRSTLDEALDADLLLFVVDASDPEWQAQLEVTREVLREVRADDIPHRILLNKVDRLDQAGRAHLSELLPEGLQVSSRLSGDVKQVREVIIAALDAQRELAELFVPYQAGALLGAIHQGAHVLSEKFDEAGALVSLRARGEFVAAWKKQLEARAPA